MRDLKTIEEQLKTTLSTLESVMVAYSGGVDSSLLAYYAKQVLGQKALVVIAISPSLAQDELILARSQAKQFAFDLIEIQTKEMENPEYIANDGSRCYHCKTALFTELKDLARQNKIKHIAYGANVDDLQDYRPGRKAAAEFQVVSPLQEVGLTKDDIRQLAKEIGLPSWDKPQAACLASRFPTFEPVTITGLSQIDQAEAYLKSVGFKQVRVRHHADLARIEISADEISLFSSQPELMSKIANELKNIGYQYVTLDLQGYQQGSSNRTQSPSSVEN